MTIYASCGCEIPDHPDGEVLLYTMDYTREGHRAAGFGSYCPTCAAERERWGIVLHNEQERKDWLEGRRKYPKHKI